ncbi:MAG TPA: hypothetical protein PKG49_00010 [Nitrosomonas mobilis]|nr:hypothetical protein [Nitrosomonas mobilis]
MLRYGLAQTRHFATAQPENQIYRIGGLYPTVQAARERFLAAAAGLFGIAESVESRNY